jgi:echinoderm microtubule-associated protein-like 6
VLPFKSAVEKSKPSNFKETASSGRMPNANLTLKHAHGFRSHDTRGNAKWGKNGEVIYTTAGLGIVQNKTGIQEFFNMHGDDVVSMDLHPNKQYVATGQMASKTKAKLVDIFVWDVDTQEVLA